MKLNTLEKQYFSKSIKVTMVRANLRVPRYLKYKMQRSARKNKMSLNKLAVQAFISYLKN